MRRDARTPREAERKKQRGVGPTLIFGGLGILALLLLPRLFGRRLGPGNGQEQQGNQQATQRRDTAPAPARRDAPQELAPFYVFRFHTAGQRVLWQGTLTLPDGTQVAVRGDRPHDWNGFLNDLTRHLERYGRDFPTQIVTVVMPLVPGQAESIRRAVRDEIDAAIRRTGKRAVWTTAADLPTPAFGGDAPHAQRVAQIVEGVAAVVQHPRLFAPKRSFADLLAAVDDLRAIGATAEPTSDQIMSVFAGDVLRVPRMSERGWGIIRDKLLALAQEGRSPLAGTNQTLIGPLELRRTPQGDWRIFLD